MKMKYALCVVVMALTGEARGQLTCTNCEFVPVGGAGIIRTGPQAFTILAGPGEFSGDITLTGISYFTVIGTGDYKLSGSIFSVSEEGRIIINAPQAGISGLEAGITFSGDRANSVGSISIESGYLTCFKNDGVYAISGYISFQGTSGVPAHIWFRNNNQTPPEVIISFKNAHSDSYLHLNGTTQTIRGLLGDGIGVVENNGKDTYFPAGMTGSQMSSSPATLNILNANGYKFTCGQIRNGIENSPALTLNISGRQTIDNFGQNVHDVTFSAESWATELTIRGPTGEETIGANVTFKGSGNFYIGTEGTSESFFSTNNSTFLVSGTFKVLGHFSHRGLNNQYAFGAETNKATLDLGYNSFFDLYGNTVIIGGLTGRSGCTIFNNFASTSGADCGYNRLIIDPNTTRDIPVFSGQILDNTLNISGNVPVVPNGGVGKGGVAIKKTGNGTQVLDGNNTYTGSTEVVTGILMLTNYGRLGGGTYTGKLDIANVEAGAPPIFEYRGNGPQVFEGDITNSGTGSILGTFIQSSDPYETVVDRRSILKGRKTFSGNVEINNGFLGGDFELSNAASVKVGVSGKIGGGEGGTGSFSADITVSGLSFESIHSKLLVTAMSATDGRPGIVNVVEKGTSNPGPLSAPNGFIIDVMGGVNQAGGYIIKCSNGIGLPLPSLGLNNTNKNICFKWDNIGLMMNLSSGNITMLASSVCPKGVNTANGPITITTTYSDSRDYLAPGATGTFTASNPSVISGSLVPLRLNDNTITTTFDGVNTTNDFITFQVTYDDGLHCVREIYTIINPLPVLSIASGTPCKDGNIILRATGTDPVTITCSDANSAGVVQNTTPPLSATITPLVAGAVKFLATDKDGCKSDYLELQVKDKPVMEPVFSGNLKTVNKGEEVAPVSFVSNGAGDTHADAYAWQQEGANNYDIGLADYTAQPPTKTATDRFTALNTTTTAQRRDMKVKPYNNSSGCYGTPIDFSIEVSPPPVTITPLNPKICANAGGTVSNQIELTASENGATTDAWIITANGNFARLVDQNPGDDKVSVEAVDTGQDEEKAVTIQFTGVNGGTATTTVTVSPRTKLESMKAIYLCEYNREIDASVTLEVKYSGQPNFAVGATTGHWKFSNPAISANPAEPAALATSATEAKGTFQGAPGTSEVRYIDNTTGCTANEYLTTITIKAMPAPAVTSPLVVCQNAPAPTLTVNETGTFRWWGSGTGIAPFEQAPILSSATVGSTDYHVTKEKTYDAQPSSVAGSATASSYTCVSPRATIQVIVNAAPVISFANGAMKLCSGALYNDAIVLSGVTDGTWAIYQSNTTNTSTISTGVTNSTTASHANIQAGNATASVIEDIFFTSNFSCKSNGLTITTYPQPVMEAVVTGNLKTVCKGDEVAAISFVSNGTGDAYADAYAWQQEGANNYDIGLADHTTQPPVKTATDRFTALNTTTSTQRRDLKVKPYNNNSGCYGAPIDFSIEVRPDIAPVITPLNAKICANAGGATSNQITLTASENAVTAASWVITANGNFAKLIDQNPGDDKVMIEAIDTGQEEEKAVTIQFTSVNGCTTATATTIGVSPRTKLEYMKATNLCEYNGGLNGSVTLEVKYSGQPNFASGATTGQWKFSNPAISANPPEPAALATSATEAKGTFQGVAGTSEVHYIDNTTGCTANEFLTTINIEAIPAPTVTATLEVCQNAPAPVLTVNETGTFKWWSPASGPEANASIPSTATAGSTEYKVSKEKTFNAQPTGATGSATAVGYTCLSPQATIRVTVNAGPVISFANGAMKLCSGALYNDAIVLSGVTDGTWAIYQSNTTNIGTISTGVTNSTTAGHSNIQAGNATASVIEDIFFTSNFSCKSNGLTITTYPQPVMEAVVTGNLKTVCKGDEVAAISFVSNGTGDAYADAYAWQQEGANNYDIGLADHTTQPPVKTATDRFTALNTTTSTQRRDLKVKPYNNNSGCYGAPIDFSIEVRPDIAPVITPLNAKICANAGGATSNQITLTASENAVTAASWVITANGNFAKLIDQNPGDDKVMIEAIDTGQEEEKAVTIQFTGVNGCTTATATTIGVSPRTKLEYMKATNLCEYNGGLNGSVTLEVKYSGQPNFASGATTGHWKFSNPAIFSNPPEPAALATSATEAKGTFQGVAGTSEVHYIDNTTGCTANEFLTTINIEAMPAPAVTSPLVVCQNAPAPTLTVNETGTFRWWGSGTGIAPFEQAPILSSATVGSTDYHVTKEKTYDAQPSSVAGSATASSYTCVSPRATIQVIVNAAPVISFANGAMKLCSGALYNDAIVLSGATDGTWAIYQSNTTNTGTISTGVTNSTTASHANIQAGNATASVIEDIFFTSNFSCKSNGLTITTYPQPVMEAVVTGNLKTVCKGDEVAAISFVSNGTGDAYADAYAWQQEGANNYDIGLADHTTQPPVKTATDRFTALNTTTSTQRRDLKVKPYNNNSGCYGAPIDFSIEVRPDIAPVVTPLNAKICANAGGATSNQITLTASENAVTAASWVITANGNFAKLIDQNPGDDKVMIEAIDTGQEEEKAVTIQFTGVNGCTTATATTIGVSPRTKLEYMKATNLCEYNGGLNGSVTLEVKYSGQPNFAVGATTGHWKFSNPAISANPPEPAALATSATEAKGTFQGVAGTSEVHYIDNTTGCTANEFLTTINIEAIPAPAVTATLEVCQNAPAPVLTVNETGTFKWWSPASGPEANAPIPSTATAGSTEYKVSKEKTFNAQPTGATGSATAVGYTCLSPQATIRVTVNAGPVISFANGAMKLCSGALYNDAIVLSGATDGTWAIYQSNTTNTGTISTGVTNSTTASHANIQAGNATASVIEDIFFISNSGLFCKSNGLTITTYPKPVMNIPNPMTICGNMPVEAFIPPSDGVAEAVPNRFKWKLAPHATNTDLIGLADYDTDWSREFIDNFTSILSATMLKREVQVAARNSISECEADKQTYTIIVKPGLSATYSANTPICTGTETDILLSSSVDNTTYSWTVNNNSVGAQSQSTASNVNTIKQTLTNTGSTSATVTYTVTAMAGSCSNTLTIPIEVSYLQGLRPDISGAGSYCTNPDTKIYQTNFTLAPQGAEVEWVYTSHASETTVSGNTQKLTKGPLTEVKDNLLLTGTTSVLVNYVFRPYNSCFGFSSQLGVTVYSSPEAVSPDASTMCSSSDLHPTTSNISLNLSAAEVAYTWTVDNAASGVTGYTQPSRNSVIPQNPPAAKTGIIADPLSISSGTAAQTVDYWITPWRSGCAGKAVQGSVVVNPLPMVNTLLDRSHCTGARVLESALDGTNGASEYIWEGGGSVGLPDQPVYSPHLSGYTAANVSEQTSAQVKIWAKNSNNCMSPSPAILTIAVDPIPSLSVEPFRALCTGSTVATAASTHIKITPSVKGITYMWRATVKDNKAGNGSDIRLVENANEVAFPFEIIVPEEGDLNRKVVATTGSDATANFKVTPTLGACRGTATDIAVRVMGADLRTYISNNASSICSGSSTNIMVGQAGDGILYSWEGTGNGNIEGLSRQETVSATSINDILTLKNGSAASVTYLIQPSRTDCVGASLTILVAVNPTPEIKVEPETAAVCSGVKTAITLSVTNMNLPESKDVLYAWQVSDNRPNNNAGVPTDVALQPDFEQQILKNESVIDEVITYTITPYYTPLGGISCSGKPATSTYRVSSPATAMISNTSEKICLGDVLTLEANVKGANCQWLKEGVGIENATSDSYTVPADIVSAFSYSVRITNSCGSSTSASRLIHVTEDAYFTEGSAAINKSTANVGEVVKFTYTGPPAEYQWDFNDATFTPVIMTTYHHYFKPGTYYPKLKLLKPGNAACTKTVALPPLEIKGAAYHVITGELIGPEGFSVFPIPAQDQLTIISENELQHITLSDLGGKIVKNESVSGQKITLSIDQLSPGVYFLTLTDSKGMKQEKIIKN